MRLHHLRLAAFGPFAGTEEVDFDELCDAGLFLLTGPTGAGKTTILDAVCFALYGSVPGVRGVKALKSQHAPDDLRPEVVLDFSVRGRRFVLRRSPEWSRPKRRGEGSTIEHASATLVETTTGEDHLLSSRAQEVGHLVGELVGMASTQFAQVAMLPQGGFQQFLRASSQDRHDVLQHLFRTDRFSRIEEWVHDHSRSLKARSGSGHAAVVRVLDSLADRAGAEVPDGLAEDEEAARTWAAALVTAAATTQAEVAERRRGAVGAALEARAAYQEGLQRQAQLQRRAQAQASLDRLARQEDVAADAARRLTSDEQAARCLPLLRLFADAVAERDRSAQTWAQAWAEAWAQVGAVSGVPAAGVEVPRLGGLSLDPDAPRADGKSRAWLAGAEEEARSGQARLQALLPRERELRRARRELVTTEADLEAFSSAHEAAAARAAQIPEALELARTQVVDLSAVSGRAEALTLQLRRAQERTAAAEAADECERSLTALRDAERDARDRAADARERVLDLTGRRLAGIAAELAGRLADGQACQVCGSTEHPRRALPASDAVTEREQSEAEAVYDDRQAAYLDAAGKVAQAEERLQGLRTAAEGQSAAAGRAGADEITAELTRAQAAEAALADAERAVVDLTRERDELTSTIHDHATRAAMLEQSASTLRTTITDISQEIAEATGTPAAESPEGSVLADQVTRLESLATALGRAGKVLDAHLAARERAQELESRATAAATEAGFADVAALRAAVLEDKERTALQQLLVERSELAARAHAVLEEEGQEGADQPAPDLQALAAALETAEERETTASRALHQSEERFEALRRHQDRLVAALDAWAPVRAEYARASSMANLVRGMGADNQLQMRLSAYVLATRLDQVVAAANERLAHMRDQRYLLQRTGRAARRGSQAGLALEVLDQWTGDVRDPTTLSGGETFVVSLALALGLADVVTQEAGGVEVETLFVDEGFGTLDAETLDDVMDRLDELRAGGRAVGVVSHVGELRNRIPTQLHVDKHRNGSTVAMRTLVG